MTDPSRYPDQAPPPAAPPSQGGTINDSRRKSPLFACLLSAMPGLGQVYVGYYQRGFVHIAVVAVLVTFLASDPGSLAPLGGFFLAFFWLYNIVDAGRRALLYNEVLAGRTDIELPRDFSAPGLGGSVAGGVTIALVGFVLLLHTRFDFSLDWVEQWWPAALILFGGFLVYRAKADAAKRPAETADEL